MKAQCPKFFQMIFDAKVDEKIRLPGIKHRQEFLRFLEFCYCDKLIEPVTGLQIQRLKDISDTLGLVSVAAFFEQLGYHIRNKLVEDLVKDIRGKI